ATAILQISRWERLFRRLLDRLHKWLDRSKKFRVCLHFLIDLAHHEVRVVVRAVEGRLRQLALDRKAQKSVFPALAAPRYARPRLEAVEDFDAFFARAHPALMIVHQAPQKLKVRFAPLDIVQRAAVLAGDGTIELSVVSELWCDRGQRFLRGEDVLWVEIDFVRSADAGVSRRIASMKLILEL